MKQGCCLNVTLFNIYINELAVLLEESTAPGFTSAQFFFLPYTDELLITAQVITKEKVIARYSSVLTIA